MSDFSNYQNVDGMAVPHTTKVYAGDKLMSEITYEKIEFNVPIEDSVFRRQVTRNVTISYAIERIPSRGYLRRTPTFCTTAGLTVRLVAD